MKSLLLPSLMFSLVVATSGSLLSQETVTAGPNMTTAVGTNPIVIVHGAWGGRHHWKETAARLRESWKGPVYRAALTGQGERVHLASPQVNLETHINDVKNLIEFEKLQDVVLFGHSYGGIVISGVADRIQDRIARMAYLDSSLLDSGENFFSQSPEFEKKTVQRAKEAGDGWLIPVDWENEVRDVPHPLATLTDKLILKSDAIRTIPAEYWAFTDGGPLEKDSRIFFYRRAQERGYSVKEFKWGHNPQRESPVEVAKEMLKTASKAQDQK